MPSHPSAAPADTGTTARDPRRINGWYSMRRLHYSLNCRSPAGYGTALAGRPPQPRRPSNRRKPARAPSNRDLCGGTTRMVRMFPRLSEDLRRRPAIQPVGCTGAAAAGAHENKPWRVVCRPFHPAAGAAFVRPGMCSPASRPLSSGDLVSTRSDFAHLDDKRGEHLIGGEIDIRIYRWLKNTSATTGYFAAALTYCGAR